MAPLQQLNLKIPPEVADHWRAQAAARGLSVRDWLVAQLGPAADASGPSGAPSEASGSQTVTLTACPIRC